MAEQIVRRDVQGREVLVDAAFSWLLFEDGWYANQDGYLIRRVRGEKIEDRKEFLHRIVVDAVPGEYVDHINGDTLDNRASNLRKCSHAENMRNRKIHKNNVSGFKGVYPDKGKWRAKITANGKIFRLGTFETPEQAHKAYCKAARELHMSFARHK